ncbi:hypothetical protein HK101_003705 [Irineochytrium annulatum]|nr:hypothetical protein HK101_003705 [Irineochytrium annulatum]
MLRHHRNGARVRQVRTNWLTHLLGNFTTISRGSRLLLVISSVIMAMEVASGAGVLSWCRGQACDRPLDLYVLVHVVRVVASFPMVVYQYLHPTGVNGFNRRHPEIMVDEVLSSWINRIKWTLDAFGLFWFFMGNWWVFTTTTCQRTSPLVYSLSVLYLTLGYIILLIPIILCGGIVFCLPCVLVWTRLLRGGNGPWEDPAAVKGSLGASDEVIRRIPEVRFRRMRGGAGAKGGFGFPGEEGEKKRRSGLSDPMMESARVVIAEAQAQASVTVATVRRVAGGGGGGSASPRSGMTVEVGDADEPAVLDVRGDAVQAEQSEALLPRADSEEIEAEGVLDHTTPAVPPRPPPPPPPPRPSPRVVAASPVSLAERVAMLREAQAGTRQPASYPPSLVSSSATLPRDDAEEICADEERCGSGVVEVIELAPEDAVCVICLNEYEEDERLRRLACFHHFHLKCVDEWLRQNKTCPLCVRDVTVYFREPETPDVMEAYEKI